jgi:hypothetical protein
MTINDSGAGAHATRGAVHDAVDRQRDRFGGITWGAAFFGWLSANGLAFSSSPCSPPAGWPSA